MWTDDNAMYDMLHNQHLNLGALPALYATARALASYVVPQEYGTHPDEKVHIGICIGGSMLHKLRRDLLAGMPMDTTQEPTERVFQLDHSVLTDVRTPKRHVRTRLYFTSESHIHSLFNVLRWGSGTVPDEPAIVSDEAHSMFHQIELSYLTHIVLRVLLRPGLDADKADSYRVQVLFSPGIQHHEPVCAAQDTTKAADGHPAETINRSELYEALQCVEERNRTCVAAGLRHPDLNGSEPVLEQANRAASAGIVCRPDSRGGEPFPGCSQRDK